MSIHWCPDWSIWGLRAPLDCLLVSLVLISLHATIESVEFLYRWRRLCPNGIFSWRFHGEPLNSLVARLPPLGIAFQHHIRLTVFIVRGAIGFITLAFALSGTFPVILVWLLFLLQLYQNFWRQFRTKLCGSEGMAIVVLGGLAFTGMDLKSECIIQAGIWFLAIQGVLAYHFAGLSKVVMPDWRSGDAFRYFMNMQAIRFVRILGQSQRFWRAAAWSVFIAELTYPIAIIGGPQAALTFLILGAIFHLAVVYLMGLHHFFWTFLATYPAIWHTSNQMPWA